MSNTTCSWEDQECEEDIEKAEQEPENESLDLDEEVQQPVCRIGGGRKPWEGFTNITRSVKKGILKCILTEFMLLLKTSITLL